MDTIKLFTTDRVEGHKIESYLGMITAHQVAGTGFFTDLTASFSDWFGGKSGAYREEMNRLFEDVKDNLQDQATALGGNAIIGVKVDFDNISAKNMSMFMVSMQGTAVKLKQIDSELKQEELQKDFVTNDLLALEFNKNLFKRKLENGESLKEDDWRFILSHNMPELAGQLYDAYIHASGHSLATGSELTVNGFPKYLSRLTYSQAVELLYNKEDCLVSQIKGLHLFSARHILKYAKHDNLDLVFQILDADKLSYSKTDLEEMKELARYLQNLPDKGKMEEVKAGILSSGGMKFVCECGNKNNKDTEYCGVCGRNIKGITKRQNNMIKDFVEKVNILEKLLDA